MTELEELDKMALVAPDKLDADATLTLYEALRPLMPAAVSAASRKAERLMDILDEFDALILDGFGVINVGADKIPGIDALLGQARADQKPIVVLTNGASHPKDFSARKYQNWGLQIETKDVVSSRDALMAEFNRRSDKAGWLCLDRAVTALSDTMENQAELAQLLKKTKGIAFLGSSDWSLADQEILESCLQEKACPVWVGNPDISAPYTERFSCEPGYWMARLIKHTQIRPKWFGKPHPAAFECAYKQLKVRTGRDFDKSRVAMVGDSLHTDILGGAAFGFSTVLVTRYGLLRDHHADKVCTRTGIFPAWQVKRI